MGKIKIGIIGGSGMDNPLILEDRKEKKVTTPFGDPSDVLILGTIKGVDCVLLARHGRSHNLFPSIVNYRANIWALKEEGCSHLIATTMCGSLQENKHPGEIVLIDDFIDRTTKRKLTFFDCTSDAASGVCHVPMNEPFCPKTRAVLASCVKALGYPFHEKGTMITIEGPRFSTRAESRLFRQWRADVVNMSTVPEVTLAKEVGLLYASVALVTDYDSWREDREAVNVELAVKTFKENADKACKVLLYAIPKIAEQDWDEDIQQNEEIARSSVLK
ncbi:S-methyl-5'-thioadenosine phosphorylase [Plakobranchus ocellatus]|uniref:S-methyl-5'-thioadenosine phosphorylase n=1 Tax=Plakobranchus ocellatus TaxID=259542 RepID=A0AAV4ADP1_9GAST|nr:S-methyl-5'-thioadenosine phosphorylase [Plakobranchus ocellatus]